MAIAKVQSFSAFATAAGTQFTSGAFTALTTGNIIVAGLGCNANACITANSGTVEWEYINVATSGASATLTLCIGRIISGGATTVTANVSAVSAPITITGIEFSGFTRHRIDRTANNAGTTSPASSGALPTTASANELWIGGVAARNDTYSSQTINTVAVDFDVNTKTTYNASTADRGVDLFYRIVSSTGAPNCSVTLSGTTVWKCALVALEETPTGGGGGVRAFTFA